VRIAQVSPLFESVPPKLYGGTERVVSFLTEALVDLGHDVTLFASGDSRTRAKLVACAPRALRLDRASQDPVARHMNMIEEVFSRADDFDVVHFHVDYLGFPLARRHTVANVTTMHGRMDIPDYQPLFRTFADAPLVSISDAQRTPLPFANWCGTVYHGLPPDLFSFHPKAKGYLAFLGRISPEKRVDRAIEIARRLNMPLKIAAKVDGKDRAYFETAVKPLLADRRVEFIGEIGEDDKDSFLGDAAALLFPIDWPEPFGLVMIEALACGTPVVAFRCGSVPEVMRDGVSGYVVDDIDQAVAATARAVELPRGRCRAYFEARFLADRMAAGYVEVYESLLKSSRRDEGHGRTAIGLAAIDTEDHDDRVPASPIGGLGADVT
jgi:glycosyltransferase involved in cell wall biosynthesis